jgi:hypothetical protein
MDIQSFFQLCGGKWISQRTTHDLGARNNQSARSDLLTEVLDSQQTDVLALCQQLGQDAAQALCGLTIQWSEVAELYQSRFKTRKEGSVLLVPLLENPSATSGKLLRQLGDTTALGTFSLGSDEAVTTQFITDDLLSEERLWFASPNLRLRSSTVIHNGQVCLTTFCSEIRMNPSTPDAAAQATSAQPTSAS